MLMRIDEKRIKFIFVNDCEIKINSVNDFWNLKATS